MLNKTYTNLKGFSGEIMTFYISKVIFTETSFCAESVFWPLLKNISATEGDIVTIFHIRLDSSLVGAQLETAVH